MVQAVISSHVQAQNTIYRRIGLPFLSPVTAGLIAAIQYMYCQLPFHEHTINFPSKQNT
jgi:hypothetical protein